MKSKSQVDFHCLRHPHNEDMAKESGDMSWGNSKMLDYHEDKGGKDCGRQQARNSHE